MLKKFIVSAGFVSLIFCSSLPAYAAQDISMHQVYMAAEAGKFGEAQAMMDKVLRDHPNSAKAHFVEAELLVKQGQNDRAQTELSTAERLAPGLPFAKPQVVKNLKARLSGSHVARPLSQSIQSSKTSHEKGIPIIVWIIGFLLVAFFVLRFVMRSIGGLFGGNRYGNPNGMGGGGGMGGGMPGAGGGGSGLLGSLASGAAMGAGLVAGEALAHRFMGDNNHSSSNTQPENNTLNDMGGSDFGIADNSSWDDGSSSSSNDDWN